MATVKPVARIGIPSTFAFPDPEALHAKDSWPDSLRWSANVPGDLCAISSKGKASENKKNLWQKIMYLLRRRFCASNRFAYVNRSTTRAVSFDLPAIKNQLREIQPILKPGTKYRCSTRSVVFYICATSPMPKHPSRMVML